MQLLVLAPLAFAAPTVTATVKDGVTAAQVYAATQPITVSEFSVGGKTAALMCKGAGNDKASCTVSNWDVHQACTRMVKSGSGTLITLRGGDSIQLDGIVLRMEAESTDE